MLDYAIRTKWWCFMSPTAPTTILPFIMRHRAPGVCNGPGGLLTTDDDHYTSVLFLPGFGPTRPVKQTWHNGLLVSPHSTALHPHYIYSLTFHENKVYLVMRSNSNCCHICYFSPIGCRSQ